MFTFTPLGKEARISWENQTLKFTGELLLILRFTAAETARVSSAASRPGPHSWLGLVRAPGLAQVSPCTHQHSTSCLVKRLQSLGVPGPGAAGPVPGRNSACLQSHTQLGVRVCWPDASGTGFREGATALLRAQWRTEASWSLEFLWSFAQKHTQLLQAGTGIFPLAMVCHVCSHSMCTLKGWPEFSGACFVSVRNSVFTPIYMSLCPRAEDTIQVLCLCWPCPFELSHSTEFFLLMLLFHYFLWAVTINYHHLAASRSTSVDDDEEEEDKLHAMLSMICSRNLTAPNRMKGFYPPPPVPQSSLAAPSTDAYNSVGIITGTDISLVPWDWRWRWLCRGWEWAHSLSLDVCAAEQQTSSPVGLPAPPPLRLDTRAGSQERRRECNSFVISQMR